MPELETTAGDLEAKTEIPEHQEAEENPVDDGYIYNFRNRDDQPHFKEEEGGTPEEAAEPEKKESPATPTGEVVKEPDKADSEPEWKVKLSSLEQSNANLQSQVANLNKALHEERQKKTEKTEEPLTRAQVVELMKQHEGDYEAQVKIMEYVSQQAVKRGKEEMVNATQVAEQKKNAEARVRERWGRLLDDPQNGPGLRNAIDQTKQMLGIDNHPMSDYLAMSAIVHERFEDELKAAVERGRAEALAGAAEEGRKKSVKESTLPKSEIIGKGGDGAASFREKYKDSIKAIEASTGKPMSAGQLKAMERIMKSKASVVQASR